MLTEVPAELKGALKGKLCNFKLDRIYVQTQIISCHSWYKLIFSGYLTPGEGGSMLRGKRSIERGYYYPGTMSSSEFTNIMTDRMDNYYYYYYYYYSIKVLFQPKAMQDCGVAVLYSVYLHGFLWCCTVWVAVGVFLLLAS